jgi:hypothetical protein
MAPKGTYYLVEMCTSTVVQYTCTYVLCGQQNTRYTRTGAYACTYVHVYVPWYHY